MTETLSWFEALILGVIQGLTEYLPVSSSGHLAIGQQLANARGADIVIVNLDSSGADNVNAQLTAIVHIVVETLLTVGAAMAKAVVIACQQQPYAKLLAKHLPHEVVGRQRSHPPVEGQHHEPIHSCLGKQMLFLLQRRE